MRRTYDDESEARKLWQARVADYRASALSVSKWCEKNGVTDHQLRYWLEKTRDKDHAATWATAEFVEDSAAHEVNAPTASIDSGESVP